MPLQFADSDEEGDVAVVKSKTYNSKEAAAARRDERRRKVDHIIKTKLWWLPPLTLLQQQGSGRIKFVLTFSLHNLVNNYNPYTVLVPSQISGITVLEVSLMNPRERSLYFNKLLSKLDVAYDGVAAMVEEARSDISSNVRLLKESMSDSVFQNSKSVFFRMTKATSPLIFLFPASACVRLLH